MSVLCGDEVANQSKTNSAQMHMGMIMQNNVSKYFVNKRTTENILLL